MTITPLPVGYKAPIRFTRPENIKPDTHFLFTTEKYITEVVYHSSMFYAPDFYKVTVKNHAGKQIWSGGDAIFLDTIFRQDFISDRYNRMILPRVNSTESSAHLQVILIDLITGKETVLTEEGDYRFCGHFISFDCIYFESNSGMMCIDFRTDDTFDLTGMLTKHFPGFKTWGACPVEDCILVCCFGHEHVLYLFNVIRQVIVDQVSFRSRDADAVGVNIGSIGEPNSIALTVSYAQKLSGGGLKSLGEEMLNVVF